MKSILDIPSKRIKRHAARLAGVNRDPAMSKDDYVQEIYVQALLAQKSHQYKTGDMNFNFNVNLASLKLSNSFQYKKYSMRSYTHEVNTIDSFCQPVSSQRSPEQIVALYEVYEKIHSQLAPREQHVLGVLFWESKPRKVLLQTYAQHQIVRSIKRIRKVCPKEMLYGATQ